MKNIGWIRIASKRYGGAIYGENVRKCLSDSFNMDLKLISSPFSQKYLKPLGWFLNLIKLKGNKDLWISDDFFCIALQNFLKLRGKSLALVYHIDFSFLPIFFKPFVFFLEKLFYRNLKDKTIVTISEYWRDYFLDRGYKNVYKIYPSFNLSEFNISNDEIEKFKEKYNLKDKPIIYLGNCQKAKGVVESYEELKNLDVHLITSGEKMINVPALNLNLDYKGYLTLLKASSLAVTMSKFKEGWNMTAHEAMLVGTPVVGSGKGGMKELLEGGGQIVCEDFKYLKEKVEFLLNNMEARKRMGFSGYDYAKEFTLERFKKEWSSLIETVIK